MESDNITQLLKDSSEGDQQAAESLYRNIYGELQIIARSHRRRWQGNETLNTTALISEAYLKMAKGDYQNRTHFYATASKAMRHVLVSYAQNKKTGKRNGHLADIDNLDLLPKPEGNTIEELLYIDQLLTTLEKESVRRSQIVECRVFGGMSIAETATALEISASTVKREWALLSAWLYRELSAEPVKPEKR